jgi:hypothetical protein
MLRRRIPADIDSPVGFRRHAVASIFKQLWRKRGPVTLRHDTFPPLPTGAFPQPVESHRAAVIGTRHACSCGARFCDGRRIVRSH